MDILNKDTINQQRAKNPFIGKSPEEIDRAIAMLEPLAAKERGTSTKNRLGSFMGDVSDVFLQSGGVKLEKDKSSENLNNIIMKSMLEDYVKSQTPEGKLARQKAQFELGQGEQGTALPTGQSVVTPTQEPTPITATTPSENAPPQYIRKPSEKYPGYEIVENPDYKAHQTRQGKVMELDVKREQLRGDLVSFFAVDDLIDRAKGGLIDTKSAAFNTWWKSIDQPIDPNTGLPDPKGAAAATHAAASKRLRVQLVRAAGDVGNINIVEQQAAEKLIPRWGDSQTTAKLKRAYLRQVSKAINSGDENDVKKTLREIGIGFTMKTGDNIPTMAGQDEEYQRYLQLTGGQ